LKKKINLKNTPKKRHCFENKKKKKKKKKKEKEEEEEEEEERWGSSATPKPLFFFGKLHPLSRLNHNL
jgi:hypothetical protein